MNPRSFPAPAPASGAAASRRRRGGVALLVLAAAVLSLHGWVIERVARAAPPSARPPPPPVLLAALRTEGLALPPLVPEPEVEVELAPTPEALVEPPVTPRPRAVARPAVAPVEAAPVVEPEVAPPVAPAAVEVALGEPAPAAIADPGLMLAAATVTGAAAVAAPGAATAPSPTYRTRIPTAAQLSYRLSRGALAGTGELDWRPDKGSYSLKLEGRLPLIGTLITQTSRGSFDAAGLAPERYTDRRLRRGEQAANFERAAGRISFSGQNPALPLSPGVQDRLSVMVQLAAIVNAWTKTPPAGEHLLIDVVGARGDLHRWSLRFEGPQAIDTPEGRVPALRFLREAETDHDTRAEFWLDPARQHLPVKVVLTDGKGEPLELLRGK